MLTLERKKIILEMLEMQSSVTVAELGKKLGISDVSVRKMLNVMDKQGLLHRTRGGAVKQSMMLVEHGETEKEKKNVREKKAIAQIAYEHIRDGDVVFLDAGSTTLQLARYIKNGDKRNIVVVTNALNIANEFLDCYDLELIVIGGTVRHRIMSCVGALAERALESICFDKVFMGANSVSIETGVTTPNLQEAEMKRKMIASSRACYLLCDYSKYGKSTMAKVCALQRLEAVIVDWNMPAEEREELLKQKVKLVVAITKNGVQKGEKL